MLRFDWAIQTVELWNRFIGSKSIKKIGHKSFCRVSPLQKLCSGKKVWCTEHDQQRSTAQDTAWIFERIRKKNSIVKGCPYSVEFVSKDNSSCVKRNGSGDPQHIQLPGHIVLRSLILLSYQSVPLHCNKVAVFSHITWHLEGYIVRDWNLADLVVLGMMSFLAAPRLIVSWVRSNGRMPYTDNPASRSCQLPKNRLNWEERDYRDQK